MASYPLDAVMVSVCCVSVGVYVFVLVSSVGVPPDMLSTASFICVSVRGTGSPDFALILIARSSSSDRVIDTLLMGHS